MTSIGQVPVTGAMRTLDAGLTAGRAFLAATATSLLLLASTASAFADAWVLDFEQEPTNLSTAISHGEQVGNKWRTTAIPGSDNVNVMISTYDRSSSGLPGGGLANLPKFTVGNGSVSSGNRRPVAFNTNQTGTAESDLQVYSSSSNRNNDIRQGFQYYSSSSDSDFDSRPAGMDSKYKPGNVLILDNASSGSCSQSSGVCSSPDTHDSGGLFVFQFSAPVSLSSIDFFDVGYDGSDKNGQHDYQQISFFDAAGTEIFVTPNSVNIASALDSDNSEGNGTQQLYIPYTGDGKWRRLTFNIENVTTMTIGCKLECAIDNIKGMKTPKGPGGHDVPEPGALALLGLGVAGMVAVRRRRA